MNSKEINDLDLKYRQLMKAQMKLNRDIWFVEKGLGGTTIHGLKSIQQDFKKGLKRYRKDVEIEIKEIKKDMTKRTEVIHMK